MAVEYNTKVSKYCQFFSNAHRHYSESEKPKKNENNCCFFPQVLNCEIAEVGERLSNATEKEHELFFEKKFALQSGTFYMAGLHPWQVKAFASFESVKPLFVLLEELHRGRWIQGIGEIGLDFSSHHCDGSCLQAEIFEAQLKLAMEWNLPITLHTVGCWQELERILSKFKPTIPLLFHRFSGSSSLLNQFAKKYNAFFSFSPEVFQAGKKQLDSLAQCPLQRLLLEDEKAIPSQKSFIAYQDFFNRVAFHRKEPLLLIKEKTSSNLFQLFSLVDRDKK